jgi:outer membrane lipoprotein-sorting protein
MIHALLLAIVFARPTPLAAESPSPSRAETYLSQMDDLWRGDASHALMRMRIKTANYERVLELEAWSKGRKRTLVRVLAPAKDAGVTTLKDGGNIYSYLPRTDRVIKLDANLLGSSWMGSHFTHDDLVKGSRFNEDYDGRISFEGPKKGEDIVELTLTPKRGAAVVWGRIVMALDSKTSMPLEWTYFDQDGTPARRIVFGEPRDVQGRPVPARLRLIPAGLSGEWSELEYDSLETGIAVDDAAFSLARLRCRGR